MPTWTAVVLTCPNKNTSSAYQKGKFRFKIEKKFVKIKIKTNSLAKNLN